MDKYQKKVGSPLILQRVKPQMPIWANYTVIGYCDVENLSALFIPSFKLG